MIAIEQLRYVCLGTRDLAAAVGFGEKILGLQLIGRTDGRA
jgi:2,3-dihydroxy-p-cumate/2,3-dihydroxybenzoate 3,4-dioxygenase